MAYDEVMGRQASGRDSMKCEANAPIFVEVYTMKQFFWQDDFISVAKVVNACLDKMVLCVCTIGLSNDSQTSDQPDVAGRDVI
jgi:hypothetical protein